MGLEVEHVFGGEEEEQMKREEKGGGGKESRIGKVHLAEGQGRDRG